MFYNNQLYFIYEQNNLQSPPDFFPRLLIRRIHTQSRYWGDPTQSSCFRRQQTNLTGEECAYIHLL